MPAGATRQGRKDRCWSGEHDAISVLVFQTKTRRPAREASRLPPSRAGVVKFKADFGSYSTILPPNISYAGVGAELSPESGALPRVCAKKISVALARQWVVKFPDLLHSGHPRFTSSSTGLPGLATTLTIIRHLRLFFAGGLTPMRQVLTALIGCGRTSKTLGG